MEAKGNTLNSTRLSLDVAQLPLTPFGMSRRGSNRKKQPVGSPCGNKLSLKTLRSPPKGKAAEDKPQANCRKTCRQLTLLKPRNPLPHTSQTHAHHSQESSANLATVYESEDAEEGESSSSSERPGIPEVNFKGDSARVNVGQVQNTDLDDYNRKRESLFTDIDEGSFIEFYHGKENNPPVQIIKEKRINTPQLYYTCEINNDTHFSTSTKTKGAVVGFRKYVEKMSTGKTPLEITEENSDPVPHNIYPRLDDLNIDETIIACSWDVLKSEKKRKKIPKENAAVNSTMIRGSLNQDYPDVCYPDISSLTLQTNTNSGKPSPDISPFVVRNHHNTVVLESPGHDSSLDISPRQENEVLPSHIRRSDPSCPANVNAIPCAVYLERDKPVKDRVGKEIFYNACEQNSLISEDVSVIDSLPNERPCDQFNLIANEAKPQSSPCSYIEILGGPDDKKICKTQGKGYINYSPGSGERAFKKSPRKPTSPHPDLNSPEVARWVLTSPFKEGSHGSSFLLRRDTIDVSETPSCPKVRDPNNSPGKVFPCGSQVREDVPRINCAKEQITFQNSGNIPNLSNPVTGPPGRNVVGSPGRYITPSSSNIGGNAVSNWIMTSPFEDGSHGSSFLLQDSTLDVSQPKPDAVHDTDDICEKSLYMRVQEKVKTCNRSLLHTFQNQCDGGSKNSSDSDSNDGVVRKRKSRNSRSPKVVISESEDSFASKQDLENLLKNVNTKRRINKSCVSQSTELFSEESDSLHLKLSGAFTKSLKASEKSLHTIGKDAASPRNKDLVTPECKNPKPPERKDATTPDATSSSCSGSASEDSDSESFIKPSSAVCNRVRRISESDEDESSEGLLPDISNSDGNAKPFKGVSKKYVRAAKEPLKNEKDYDKGRSLSNKKEKVNKRPTSSTKKFNEYMTSDEDSSLESSIIIRGNKSHKIQVSQGRENTPTTNLRKKTDDNTYCPSTSSEEDESSFEDYLKIVKKKIQEEKVPKPYPSPTRGGSLKSFIDDDESGEDLSFYLPPLSERLKPKIKPSSQLDGRSAGSVSEDLEMRILKKQSEKNIPKKKGTQSKSSTSPINSLKKPTVKKGTNITSWRKTVVLDISSDSDSDSDVFPERGKVKNLDCPQSFVTPANKAPPKGKSKTEIHPKHIERKVECSGTPTLTFLASLSSTVHTIRCHPDALLFVKSFKKKKEELCKKLYSYYNEHIFSERLPSVMSVTWNARLTKTAGFCYYQIDRSKPDGRGARIELSSKVIDVPERLRDTLIHEMCHAAAWIISGYKDGHGPLWKSWAARARSVFPELPAITTCHSYKINCKYTYRCTRCSYSIGRHSKSLDTERKVCGLCFGKFELIVNSRGRGSKSSSSGTPSNGPQTPRTPGAFALFVKENYNSVKKSKQNLKHVDVMKILSADFAKLKTGSN